MCAPKCRGQVSDQPFAARISQVSCIGQRLDEAFDRPPVCRQEHNWSPKPKSANSIEAIITTYINRFRGWVYGGLEGVPFNIGSDLEDLLNCAAYRHL